LGRHVLAHVADLHGFVKGLHTVLDHDGVAAVEVPHLLPYFHNLEYDTVYHEHLCYFSLRVLKTLFHRFDMDLVDLQEVPIHGGSIVVTAQRRGGPHRQTPAVGELLRREEQAGLDRLEPWLAFAKRVGQSRVRLLEEIDYLWAKGCSLAGYGA